MPDTESLESVPSQSLEPINQHRNRTGPKGIPLEILLTYKKKGLSYIEIAKLLQIHPKTAYLRIRPHLQDIENLEPFRQHRVDILTLKQREALQYVTPAKLAKASVNNIGYYLDKLHNMERLESGKSTSNLAYTDMIKHNSTARTEVQVIEAELSEAGIDVKQLVNK